MKATNHFKQTIKTYLDHRAEQDILFADTYNSPDKSIDDCVTYIMNTVQKSGCNGFADDEIYSMAIHYYCENDIEIGTPISGKVVVNHVVELTEQEKEDAREEALERVKNEQYAMLKRPAIRPTAKQPTIETQPNLFGL